MVQVLGLAQSRPLQDFTLRSQGHSLAAEGPTHVADADKIRGGHSVQHADFGAQQRGLAAESHGTDAQFIAGGHDVPLQFVKLGLWVFVLQPAEELLFGLLEAGGAVAADAYPQDAGAAAFALRLEHGIQDDLTATVKVAVGLELFIRQRVLGADVFAAAPFKYEPDREVGAPMLMKMESGRAGSHDSCRHSCR